MQRHVVEDAQNAAGPKMRAERLALLQRRQEQVIHVIRLLTMARHDWKPNAALCGPVLERHIIALPDLLSARLDARSSLKLRIEKRCEQVGRQIARAHVHPGVLVHLAAEEATPVGALLANDLGALEILRISD